MRRILARTWSELAPPAIDKIERKETKKKEEGRGGWRRRRRKKKEKWEARNNNDDNRKEGVATERPPMAWLPFTGRRPFCFRIFLLLLLYFASFFSYFLPVSRCDGPPNVLTEFWWGPNDSLVHVIAELIISFCFFLVTRFDRVFSLRRPFCFRIFLPLLYLSSSLSYFLPVSYCDGPPNVLTELFFY